MINEIYNFVVPGEWPVKRMMENRMSPPYLLSTETEFSTLPETLMFQAHHRPKEPAFSFLQGKKRICITYEDLHERVLRLAGFLRKKEMSGKQAILLYLPGLEFIVGFFACLFAGVVAVPASPPATDRLLSRLISIIDDAGASMILTDGEMLAHLKKLNALHRLMAMPLVHHVGRALLKKSGLTRTLDSGHIPIVATDTFNLGDITPHAGDGIPLPGITGDSLAFIQYTSGSTGSPKGVMVTHRNILHNSRLICDATHILPGNIGLNWLPMYHDMGIITGVILPIHFGFLCHLMSPVDFISDPLSWIRYISENRVTHSGGPNFAYALCIRRFDPQQLKGVDLSSWQVAFCGAEPISPETMEQFANMFAPYGFRAETLMPCYGLAESTVGVCWTKFGNGPVYKDIDAELVKHNIIAPPRSISTTKQLVGSGRTGGGLKIMIVDPETRQALDEDQIGEVWVSGDSVAAGYWNKPDITDEVFKAKIVNRPEEWLRSGDLGFISDKELYITGRIKDLIIVRGKNHYPQDIESTVQKVHPAVRQGSCIAFSTEIAGQEALVVALEVRPGREDDYDEMITAIRKAVALAHELVPHAIVLLSPKAIPKTSSGKLQRKKCKSLFENNEWTPVKVWIRGGSDVSEKI